MDVFKSACIPTCRHLRGRLPFRQSGMEPAPILSGSDSASSLPQADTAAAHNPAADCRKLLQQQTANQTRPVLPSQDEAFSTGAGLENTASAATTSSAEPPCRLAAAEDSQESDREAGGRTRSAESTGQGFNAEGSGIGGVRYFEDKKLSLLTGWWESAAAFSAVFLLPLISVVPCSTTAVRDDDVVV